MPKGGSHRRVRGSRRRSINWESRAFTNNLYRRTRSCSERRYRSPPWSDG